MFSVALFYISLGLLLGLFGVRYLENQELGDEGRYFTRTRDIVDGKIEYFKNAVRKNLSLKAFTKHAQVVFIFVQHNGARLLAKIAHSLEHRARKVVHKTARRSRSSHYLFSDKDTNEEKEG